MWNFVSALMGWQLLDADTELVVHGFVDNFVKANNLSLAAGASIQITWPEDIEGDEVRLACIRRLEKLGFDVTMDDFPQEYQIHIVQVRNVKTRNDIMCSLRHMRDQLKIEVKELVLAYIKQYDYESSMPFPDQLGRYELNLDTVYSRQLREVFIHAFSRKNYRVGHFSSNNTLYYDNGDH